MKRINASEANALATRTKEDRMAEIIHKEIDEIYARIEKSAEDGFLSVKINIKPCLSDYLHRITTLFIKDGYKVKYKMDNRDYEEYITLSW